MYAVVIITGNLWVKKGNLHLPHRKPTPLQRVVGFPLSQVQEFIQDLVDFVGSCTVRSRRFPCWFCGFLYWRRHGLIFHKHTIYYLYCIQHHVTDKLFNYSMHDCPQHESNKARLSTRVWDLTSDETTRWLRLSQMRRCEMLETTTNPKTTTNPAYTSDQPMLPTRWCPSH